MGDVDDTQAEDGYEGSEFAGPGSGEIEEKGEEDGDAPWVRYLDPGSNQKWWWCRFDTARSFFEAESNGTMYCSPKAGRIIRQV